MLELEKLFSFFGTLSIKLAKVTYLKRSNKLDVLKCGRKQSVQQNHWCHSVSKREHSPLGEVSLFGQSTDFLFGQIQSC